MTTYDQPTRSTFRSWLGVGVIAASLFTFVITELMPVGLLTPVSTSLNVSVGTAGLMVTLFGVAAGLGVPFISGWTRRINRRALLSALLVVLAVGNVVTSIAPNYPVLLAARLVMGLAHGAFWAIGLSMAMRIVEERHASRAAAIVMSGLSLAAVAGLPLGTFLEGLTDWRTTFLIMGGLGAVVFVAVATIIPSLPSQGAVSVREVFGLPVKNVRLRMVMITVMLYVFGHFAVYTFIRPFIENEPGTSFAYVVIVLAVFGVGGVIGNMIAGNTVNKNLKASFVVGCAGLVVALLLLVTLGREPVGLIIAVAVWGLSFGAANLSQINMTLEAAPDTFEAAMSINTLQYNLSIALGAFVGGLIVDSLGLSSVVWFGVALTAVSFAVALSWYRPASEASSEEEVAASA